MKKLTDRLDNIDDELGKLKDKVDGNERINKRMDDRLTALEKEMRRATQNKEKSDKLRDSLQEQTEGRNGLKNQPPRRNGQEEEIQHLDTAQIEGDLRNTFRSSWAREMQEELNQAAGMKAKQVENGNNQPRGRMDKPDHWGEKQMRWEHPSGINRDNHQQKDKEDRTTKENRTEWKEREEIPKRRQENEEIPDRWQDDREIPDRWEEILTKKKVIKVRKPTKMKIEEWFGFNSDTTDSSDENEDDTWTEIDRQKKKNEKRIRRNKKRKDLETQTAAKAANIVGLGPVDLELLEKLKNEKVPYEKAKIIAIKTLLSEQLEYNSEELDELTIKETKMTSNGEKVIYTALEDHRQVRELYIRKAEIKNDKIIVRQYIPPNFYERFSHLNMICREKRMEDETLKTQIRFGKKDLEIFVKHRGDETPFKLVRMYEFTDVDNIPPFDHQIKWKRIEDRQPRRRTGTQSQTGGPSNRKNDRHGTQRTASSIRRQLSNTSDVNKENKKTKLNEETEDDNMESSSSGSGSDTDETEESSRQKSHEPTTENEGIMEQA